MRCSRVRSDLPIRLRRAVGLEGLSGNLAWARPGLPLLEFDEVIKSYKGCRYKVSHLSRDKAAAKMGHPHSFQ